MNLFLQVLMEVEIYERINKSENGSDSLKIQPKLTLSRIISEDIERQQRYKPVFNQMIVDDSEDSDNSNCSSVSKNHAENYDEVPEYHLTVSSENSFKQNNDAKLKPKKKLKEYRFAKSKIEVIHECDNESMISQGLFNKRW